VALSAIIERVRARGERGVLYDYKGDYTARFFRPGIDVLFNPLDTRCAGWNLFNDIETQMDVDALAASLIPRAYHADPFWNDAARAVFTGLLHHLYATGRRDNAALWEAVSSDIKDIAGWLRETPHGEAGYTFIQDAGSKQALSVHSVVMQYARAFEFLAGVSGDFSVVDWLRDPKGEPGWIFVTNYSDIQDTLRPILSLFVDLLGRKLLALPDDFDRRVFFFLDEFGTLQRLPTIVSLLTLSRSKGGSVWVGVQDVGQIDKLYTQDLRKAIVNACGNSLLFAVSDPDTAKYLSEKIGETEFVEMDQTYSMGPSEMRDGVALAQRKKKEPLVLPSELMALPDLTAYLRVGALPLTQTRFTFQPHPARQAPFSVRPDLRLDAAGETDPPGPREGGSRGPDSTRAEGRKTVVTSHERGGEGDPAGEHDLNDLPDWMEGPEAGEKTEGEEREEIARRDNEELFHDGVGPAEMEQDDDSRAIEMSDGLEGPTG
jgi:type IV secretory pathway TraG/TraD family ATPase VirD4